MKNDVFISYSSKEYETANIVRQSLKSNEIKCWMAPESIPVGSNYSREIPKGIRESHIFLLILSSSSQDSIWVSREIDQAINERKTIIPFQIEDFKLNDSFNFYLSQVQRIAAFSELQESLNKLVDKIKAIVNVENSNNLKTVKEERKKETKKEEKTQKKNNRTIYDNGDIYEGELVNGKKNGKGKMEYTNGDVYEGLFKDDLKIGKGKMIYANGNIYEGFFAKDRPSGKGKLKIKNIGVYEGEFYEGKFNGKGILKTDKNTIKEGMWKEDNLIGRLKYMDEDGIFWANCTYDEEYGIYKLIWENDNSSFYEGQMKYGLYNGRGKYIYSNGDCYEGEWKNNERDGKGKYVYSDGTYYEGEWKSNITEGKGKKVYSSGNYYEGEWKKGKKDGKGKYIFKDGSYREGEFKENKFLNGVFYDAGKRKEIIYEN